MLTLNNVSKIYTSGETRTKALDGVTVSFREREFVAILGPSGSGKTTCLNIIGGLDRCTSGELIIKGKSTADFKDADRDAYRNNSIGFVFQSYNLISHISVIANVELALTLSGMGKTEKRRRAIRVLRQVGLGDQLNKKPSQLSGGQMQRVAIARALANDPEILLCDEPTGALDSETSIQIMNLIADIASERLVIMVTHNSALAKKYASRIISFKDGKIVKDTNPYVEPEIKRGFRLVRTSMSFLTALSLSFGNIVTKKGRTFLTSFASSIGIIGIALVLALSGGFQTQLNDYQSNALAEFPIIVAQGTSMLNASTISESMSAAEPTTGTSKFADSDSVYLYDEASENIQHQNVISQEFLDYVAKLTDEHCSAIGYMRTLNLNLLRKSADGEIVHVSLSSSSDSSGLELSTYPAPLNPKSQSYIEKNFDLMRGKYPTEPTDLVIAVDSRNRVKASVLKNLGFITEGEDGESVENIGFDELLGTEIKYIPNDVYFTRNENGSFSAPTDFEAVYANPDCVTLRICGIVRIKEDVSMTVLGDGLLFCDTLTAMAAESAANSQIALAQLASDNNVMTLEPASELIKQALLFVLGADSTPAAIYIYPVDFASKDYITNYLDAFNKDKSTDDAIVYTDLAETISSLTGDIMGGITVVLVAFASISLVVSLIMIAIITYTSVLERTKEIGILKALGARKKDITRVFDAETCIIGLFSGILGIALTLLIMMPANVVIENITGLTGVAQLNPLHALLLILLSTALTMLGGHIPAKLASRRDAVEALRSE